MALKALSFDPRVFKIFKARQLKIWIYYIVIDEELINFNKIMF